MQQDERERKSSVFEVEVEVVQGEVVGRRLG